MSYSQGPYYGTNVQESGGGGGFLSSQSSPGDGTKKMSLHSLRPLTILALYNAQQAHGEANFTVDGVEIGQVTVVAQLVKDVETQQTNLCFTIDDGTARIDARHWLDQNESAGDFANIKEGSYVRVMGTLKQISTRRHLTAPTIRLASAKEFLFHKADVMLVWAKMTLEAPSVQTTHGMHSTGGDASVYAPGGGQAPQQNANYAHLPALDRSILECMHSAPQYDEGVNVNHIATQLSRQGEKISAGEISVALDRLMDDGHIYTTIDDSHFRIA